MKYYKLNFLPTCFYKITNFGITNLSTRVLTENEKILLSCGLKFCLIPNNIKKDKLINSFELFVRRLRIRKQFINITTDNNQLLRVSNPSFIPTKASNCLETYIASRREELLKLIAINSKTPSIKHNGLIHKILANLKSDDSIIIRNTDKNLGVVVMDRLEYEREVLYHLIDVTSYS